MTPAFLQMLSHRVCSSPAPRRAWSLPGLKHEQAVHVLHVRPSHPSHGEVAGVAVHCRMQPRLSQLPGPLYPTSPRSLPRQVSCCVSSLFPVQLEQLIFVSSQWKERWLHWFFGTALLWYQDCPEPRFCAQRPSQREQAVPSASASRGRTAGLTNGCGSGAQAPAWLRKPVSVRLQDGHAAVGFSPCALHPHSGRAAPGAGTQLGLCTKVHQGQQQITSLSTSSHSAFIFSNFCPL